MSDGPGGLAGKYLPEDPDAVDALRLAEVLERVEAGRAPDLDPTEDPALSHLLVTAMRVRAEMGTITDEHAFRSFHHRSRQAILHSLEGSRRVVPFYRRPRLVGAFAAAAAAAAIAFTSLGPGLGVSGTEEGATAAATNLTPRTTTEELDRLASAIADIQERAQAGQPVPAPLLRAVSEGTARVANLIEQTPDRVTKEAVTTYIQAAQTGQQVLKSVTVEQDAHGALAAAQRAARDGVVVAGRFLDGSGTPTGTPTSAPAPTATATSTAAPAGTSAATPSSTPAATSATPSSTAAPTGTPGATPAGTPAGTGTAAPTATPATSTTPPPSDVVR